MAAAMRDCAPCQHFVDDTIELFGDTLARFAFEFVECNGEREGRECHLMYRSPWASLLFVVQDSSPGCLLGGPDLPIPPFPLLHGKGEYGWYDLELLAEIEAGRRLVSRCLLRKFVSGRASYYEWQAALLAERAERLFPLLDPARAGALQARVERHLTRKRRWVPTKREP